MRSFPYPMRKLKRRHICAVGVILNLLCVSSSLSASSRTESSISFVVDSPAANTGAVARVFFAIA